jgi:hypothetical protein
MEAKTTTELPTNNLPKHTHHHPTTKNKSSYHLTTHGRLVALYAGKYRRKKGSIRL